MDIKKISKAVEPVVDVNEVSRISTGTVIKGDISSKGDIRIDGSVQGKVYSQARVVVGEKAVLNGALFCENTDFWGRMDGDIYVKDTLSLMSNSVVSGSINVRQFQVELGAKIDGTFSMITEEDYDKVVASIDGKPSKGKANL